jgi:hypothetical protein
LFGTGSEAYAIIPESTLDDIIHNATHTEAGRPTSKSYKASNHG